MHGLNHWPGQDSSVGQQDVLTPLGRSQSVRKAEMRCLAPKVSLPFHPCNRLLQQVPCRIWALMGTRRRLKSYRKTTRVGHKPRRPSHRPWGCHMVLLVRGGGWAGGSPTAEWTSPFGRWPVSTGRKRGIFFMSGFGMGSQSQTSHGPCMWFLPIHCCFVLFCF